MKGLLQNRRFKKNLKKWLCMYVGTLLILTSVVTYSKYISKLGVSDTTRITKFNVSIDKPTDLAACIDSSESNNTPCCNGNADAGNLECTTKNFRPTQEISYEFVVNTDLEVNTVLSTTIYALSDFKIVKFEEGSNVIYEENKVKDSNCSLGTADELVGGNKITRNTLTFTRNIKMPDDPKIPGDAKSKKTYKVTLKLNYSPSDIDNVSAVGKTDLNIIKVGYSATQSKN